MASSVSSDAAHVHRAARIEDAVHEWRARWARRRGHVTTVVPYTGYGAPGWIRVLGRVVLAKDPRPGSRAERKYRKREERIRGWRSFTSVPVGSAEVVVQVEAETHLVTADRGGVIDELIPVALEPGWHTISLRPTDTGSVSQAPVFVVDPSARLGVISDVDDTVMVTALPRPLLAAWNTFVLDEHARVPTPGMAVLLDRIANSHHSVPVMYVSTGAWNVAPTLRRFLSRNLFPAGPLLLTDWGPTHDRWFRSGRAHKVDSLERLAQEFPDLKWLLIGDDGQHDEQIYAAFAAAHADNVAAVVIRQLSPSEAVLAGRRSAAEKRSAASPVPWVYGPDGAALLDQVEKLGLLD